MSIGHTDVINVWIGIGVNIQSAISIKSIDIVWGYLFNSSRHNIEMKPLP